MSRACSEPSSHALSFDRLPGGTHLCHLYRGEGELLSAAVPFLRAGLAGRERCVWITSDPALLRQHLTRGQEELDALFGSGQIEIVHQRAWRDDAPRRRREAMAAGFRGLRVAGDMACAGGAASGEQDIALCSFPLECLSARGLLDLFHGHPHALVREGADWTQIDTGLAWLRDDVLALASHEIKTPLTSLRLRVDGLLRRLRAGALDPAEVEIRLARALEQCDRLDALVSNLLDASRASAGSLPILLEPGDLGDIVRATAERFADEFGHRGGSFTVKAEPIPGLWDRSRVERVVSNLVGNALRHAPGAPVEVRARRHDALALIEVRDAGPGIPAGLLESLFERLTPIGPRQGSGLGIGLWIVREIVGALGGTIAVASEPGRGVAFTIALPSAHVTPRPGAQA